jgi:hypothetical protein
MESDQPSAYAMIVNKTMTRQGIKTMKAVCHRCAVVIVSIATRSATRTGRRATTSAALTASSCVVVSAPYLTNK